jgi:protein SCO1/2
MKTKTAIRALALIVGIPLLTAASDSSQHSCCTPAAPATSTNFTDQSLYQTESTWTTDEGKQIQLGALRGRPRVVAMFFTSCQFTCPIIVNDLKRVEAALPDNVRTNVGFTLISFDSDRDIPTVLKAFRVHSGLPESNWTLLHGDPDAVRELAALLGVNYRQDARGQFAHSNLITVLNAGGEIVYQQAGVNLPPDELVKKLVALFPK